MYNYSYTHSYDMAKENPRNSNGADGDTNNDILFDPLSMSSSPSSKSYEYETSNPDFMYTNSKKTRHWEGGRRAGGGVVKVGGGGGGGRGRHFRRGLFNNIGMTMRREDEDDSHYLPEYNSGITRVLSLMQIIIGMVIILIGIFAYVAKATVGPLIPAMDIGCGFVLYITGGVLGMFTRCRAKRMVAAFILLSSCSFIASLVLGAIHALAGFRMHYICAYLHCGNTSEESSRQVMDGVIAILNFIEAIFALVSVIVGIHGFCKYSQQK